MKARSLRSRTRTGRSAGAMALVALAPACSAAPESDPAAQEPPPIVSECTADPPCSGAAVDKQGRPATCVETVEGTVLSSHGQPVSGFLATLCGSNLCQKTQSDAKGNLHLSVCRYMTNPALEIPGRSAFVSYAVPVRAALFSVGSCGLIALEGPGDLIESSTSTRTYAAAGVTLTISAGTDVLVSEVDHPDPDDRKFRAARLPASAAPALVEASPGLQLFWGLAPTATKLSAPAKLTVPNPEGWLPETRVGFYIQGVPGLDGAGAPAEWTQAATGRVEEDGTTITTDTGIAYLSLVGIKQL